ncbi:hypothetical protein K2X96_03330 [Patescibacteria group bacterium]|nr:hypothetical protein [Patescibacteria group bacterium]
MISLVIRVVSIALLLGVGFVAGYSVRSISSIPALDTITVNQKKGDVDTNASTTQAEGVVEQRKITEPIVVQLSTLNASQKIALKAIGIEGETFILTEAMAGCAYDTLGGSRVEAIVAGDIPSVSEMVRLAPCMK